MFYAYVPENKRYEKHIYVQHMPPHSKYAPKLSEAWLTTE